MKMHEHFMTKSLCSIFKTFTLRVTHFYHTLSLLLPTTDCNSENQARGNCNSHTTVHAQYLFNLSKNNSLRFPNDLHMKDVLPTYKGLTLQCSIAGFLPHNYHNPLCFFFHI